MGRGKSHVCTEAEAVKNVARQALDLGANFGNPDSVSYQRVSTKLIKVAEEEMNVPRGEKFSLATGGERERKRERENE